MERLIFNRSMDTKSIHVARRNDETRKERDIAYIMWHNGVSQMHLQAMDEPFTFDITLTELQQILEVMESIRQQVLDGKEYVRLPIFS